MATSPTDPMTVSSPADELIVRRARARRMAMWLGALATAVFVGFIVMNVLVR